MPKLIYQPRPGDNDETAVMGVPFRAYEATEFPAGEVFDRLSRNPFFLAGETPDQVRYLQWVEAHPVDAVPVHDTVPPAPPAIDHADTLHVHASTPIEWPPAPAPDPAPAAPVVPVIASVVADPAPQITPSA